MDACVGFGNAVAMPESFPSTLEPSAQLTVGATLSPTVM